MSGMIGARQRFELNNSLKSKNGSLGFRGDDCYRTIPEARMVEMLVFYGWAYESDSPESRLAAKDQLQHWTSLGLRFSDATNGERLFDPVEVINFLTQADIDGRDTFWSEKGVSTARRLAMDLTNGSPSGQSSLGERPFSVLFRRQFNLQRVPEGSRLRLRMPLPLEGDHPAVVEVMPFTGAAPDAKLDVRPGRLELRMVSTGETEVTLGAELKFMARPHGLHQRPDFREIDRELYLTAQEGLIVVSKQIVDLARSLAGANAPPPEAVRAFWNYIQDELMFGAVHYDQVDPASPCNWVLDSGWCDCQLGSALFVALCRAFDIPARIVGGHCLFQRSPFKHYWAEVWMDAQGWAPFDFLSWNLSCGGRDPEWRDYYFGRLDYRLVTDRLPKEFTGAPGVPIPSAWIIVQAPAAGGVELDFLDINGTLIYADTVILTD